MKRAHPFWQEILRCPRDYDGQKTSLMQQSRSRDPSGLLAQRAQLPASEFLMQRSEGSSPNTIQAEGGLSVALIGAVGSMTPAGKGDVTQGWMDGPLITIPNSPFSLKRR